LLIMTAFSLMCLPFIGQLPAIAEQQLGIDARSTAYGYFYAAFGVGALVGAGVVGTVLLRADKVQVTRATLALFAVALAWLSTVETITVAYAAIFFVGLFYFALPTTLNTLWQHQVDDSIRGRVSALWVLSFGGTVPVANLIAGPVIEATSLGAVMLFGALAAIAMAVAIRIPPGPVVGEEILTAPPGPRVRAGPG
jgi:predicted MFS family arabinose efflux permease